MTLERITHPQIAVNDCSTFRAENEALRRINHILTETIKALKDTIETKEKAVQILEEMKDSRDEKIALLMMKLWLAENSFIPAIENVPEKQGREQ